MTVWTKIEIPAVLQPPATQYGYMLDYLYAVNQFDNDGEMGSNIARRAEWPTGMYIYAREFTEEEIEDQGVETPLPHGVFLVYAGDEIEFEPSNETMCATDWLIGTRI
jgi:hypothetical protein